MLKKYIAAAFALGTFLVAPVVSAYSNLDYMEGSWYDASGKLFAVISNGRLNSHPMQLVSSTGSDANFAAAVQVTEANGLRNIPLEFSDAPQTARELQNPFYRPVVRINGVDVHKEWFQVPRRVNYYLNGNWKDTSGKLIAQFYGGRFNSFPYMFLSFYGTADHFNATIRIDEHGKEHFYALELRGGAGGRTLSIRDMGTNWQATNLRP